MTSPSPTCLNCNRTEHQVPLLNLRFSGKEGWVCSQCLPILIHKPQQLADKLDLLEPLEPVPDDD